MHDINSATGRLHAERSGRQTQSTEWVDLQRLSLRSEPLASGIQMTFPARHAARVLDLAEREAACCAFLSIAASLDGDEVVVQITSDNPEAIGVIAALSGSNLS